MPSPDSVSGWWQIAATASGAFIALVGVGGQMWFDRRQRERARRWELKRDVFLEAIGAVGAFQAFLMELGNANVDVDEASKEVLPKLKSLSQTDVVSDTPTLEALGKLAHAVQGSAYRIMSARIPLMRVDTDLSIARKAEADRTALLQAIRQTQAQATTAEISQVQGELDAIDARVTELLHEKRDVVAGLVRLAVEENSKITALRVDAVAAMRRELGIKTDQQVLADLASRAADLSKRAVDDLDKRSAEILRGNPRPPAPPSTSR